MVITYYGTSCFRVQSGETVIGFDPPSKKSEKKSPRFEAHLVLISHDHDNHNGKDILNPKNKDEVLFVIDGPGEYEIKGMQINGIESFHDNEEGKKYGLNTIYTVKVEGMNICHLGDFGEKTLRDEIKEAIDGVDILFIPIGGDSVINAENASVIINKINPNIVIPMHFGEGKSKKALEIFMKEMGQEKFTEEEKLTVKKKDIVQDETKIVALKPAI